MLLLRPTTTRVPDDDVDVLLVEDVDAEADLAVEALSGALPTARVRRCRTLAEARAARRRGASLN